MGDETKVNIAEADSAARELSRAGMAWSDAWQGLKGQLQSSGSPAAFGNDQLGQQLFTPYDTAAQAAMSNATLPSDAMLQFGDGASAGVQHVADQDAANGRSMPA